MKDIYCHQGHIASNSVFHKQTKHLKIIFLLVRENVQKGVVRLFPISYLEQLADFLYQSSSTKILLLLFKFCIIYLNHDPSCEKL
jgi:hypothetical protein